MIDEKKLIEEMAEEIENCYGRETELSQKARGYLNQPKSDNWIPCSECLPEEPEELPTEDCFIEEMIIDGKFKEYIVMIYGAEEATTLYYVGNGNWHEECSNECYKVIAWQPLPEPYKKE